MLNDSAMFDTDEQLLRAVKYIFRLIKKFCRRLQQTNECKLCINRSILDIGEVKRGDWTSERGVGEPGANDTIGVETEANETTAH